MAELQTSRAIQAEKAETVAAVQKRLRAAKLAIVTEYRGLNVDQMTRLRREIRQASGEYQVIKNTLVNTIPSKSTIVNAAKYLCIELLSYQAVPRR